jgi:hypothetical protein
MLFPGEDTPMRVWMKLLLLNALLAWLAVFVSCHGGGSRYGDGGGQGPIQVAVLPREATVTSGQSQSFSATVTGSSTTTVTWSVVETSGGSVTGAGLYTAPGATGTYHVKATSVADPGKSDQATVTVTAPPVVNVTVNPHSASLLTGQNQSFSATVTGSSTTTVTWSVVEPGGGSVTGTGLYTAPGAAGNYHVKATSVADPGKSDQATVTVTAPPVVNVTVNPHSASLLTGQNQSFSATVTGSSSTAVTWSVVEPGGGRVTGAGLYTAPGAAGTYHVKATSVADPRKSDQATVTVTAPPVVNVAVNPHSASLLTGQSQSFNATVTGSSTTAVTWSVVEPGGGSVTGAGLYTAPGAAGTYHVKATSVADPGQSDQATVTVTAPPVVNVMVNPQTASLQTAQSQSFSATVTGSSTTTVTWSVVEPGGGSVTGAGLYTAPGAAGTYHVKATSVADPSKSDQATVTVTAPPVVNVTVSPQTASLQTGQSQSFSATVTGSSTTAVTWSVVETSGGSVTSAGFYTTPGSAGTYHVKATSVADPSKSDQATVTVTAPIVSSNYLHLASARLAQVRADAGVNGAAWAVLKQNVDANLTSTDPYSIGPENLALAYLVSGDARYAARAYWWAQQNMAEDISLDSYYFFGELMQSAAMVLNYCAPALTPAQISTLANYLDASTDELWNHNRGSGWGLDNPRNNYHHTFLMGTAYSGYALKSLGDPRGDTWIAKVKSLLEKPGGVMDYLNTGVPGGDWDEGVNYAEGAKHHLAMALSVIAGAGGTNYFNASFFFSNLGRFMVYAVQPGNAFLYPAGDLARDSSMHVSPYDRGFIQPSLFWLSDSEGRRLGQWFLNHVVSSYLDGANSFNWRTGLYLEVLFGQASPETAPSTQPLYYRTPVTNWINLRSGWDSGATSVTISGSPRILESHQHMDTGAFTIWKNDWQAVDASTFSHSGELPTTSAHNLLRVPNARVWQDDTRLVPGVTRFGDYGSFAYVQADLSHLYPQVVSSSDIRDMVTEHTREFVYLRPSILLVFDRVAAAAAGAGYAWCLHFPVAPAPVAGGYAATYNGGGMAMSNLLNASASVVSDMDQIPWSGDTVSSYRVEEAAPALTSRFLNALELASPSEPPASAKLLTSSAGVRAVFVQGQVVVFSDAPRGAAASLPFTYTVPGTTTLTHVFCNLGGAISATAAISSGNTVVTVSAGGGATPDGNGLVSLGLTPK